MRKSTYYIIGAFLLSAAAAVFVSSWIAPELLTNLIVSGWSEGARTDEARRADIERDYGVSFAFAKKAPGSLGLYIPEYDYLDMEQAELYTRLLGVEGQAGGGEDADPFYRFKGDGGEVWVNKYFNRIIVKYSMKDGTNAPGFTLPANDGKSTENSLIPDEKLVIAALAYLDGTLLPVDYAEYRVIYRDTGYDVVFLPVMDGLINLDHTVTVSIDGSGGVTGLDYFKLTYERIAEVKVISMREAYYSLPLLTELPGYEGGGFKVDLSRCELVYRFEDSILQPFYHFTGTAIDRHSGETVAFAYSVSASMYR